MSNTASSICYRHTCDEGAKDLHRGRREDFDDGLANTLSGSFSHSCLLSCRFKESTELYDFCIEQAHRFVYTLWTSINAIDIEAHEPNIE